MAIDSNRKQDRDSAITWEEESGCSVSQDDPWNFGDVVAYIALLI